MYDRAWPIRTHMEPLPPAKFVQDRSGSHGMTMNSLVSGGCIVSGSVVVHSVLFPRVRVNSFCTIDSSLLLPDVHVGRSCRLRRCIIDRACHIPEGMVIGENADEDSACFYRSEGGGVSDSGYAGKVRGKIEPLGFLFVRLDLLIRLSLLIRLNLFIRMNLLIILTLFFKLASIQASH